MEYPFRVFAESQRQVGEITGAPPMNRKALRDHLRVAAPRDIRRLIFGQWRKR